MKLAVTAASGQLGSTAVQALKRFPGLEPIAIARTPGKAASLGVETRPGNYDNKPELVTAFAGVDTALLVSGMAPPDERIVQHRNVIEAASEAGVKKMVYTGILTQASGDGFNAVQNASLRTEEILKQSGMNWSIAHNGIYIEPDLDYIETYKKSGEIANCAGDGKCAYTSRPELAEAYVKMLTEDRHNGKTYTLVGEGITQKQLAQYINEVYGTSLTFRNMTVEEYRKERSDELGEFLGGIIAGIYEGISKGAMDAPSDFEEIVGRKHLSPMQMIIAYKNKAG